MTIIDWHSEANAEIYDEYCKQSGLFRGAGEALVDIAAIEDGDTILDFACGTGAATEVIAESCNQTNRIIGIDYSAAQIAEARKKKWPTNVSFMQGAAADLPRLVDTKIDVVICNCAFWFLDIPEFLRSIDQVGSARCRVAFNVFGDPLPHREKPTSGAAQREKPSALAMAREMAVKEFGYSPPPNSPADEWYKRQFADYVEWFDASAFRITCLKARTGRLAPRGRSGGFFEVPVFLTSHLPGLEYEKALSVYRRAEEQIARMPADEDEERSDRFSWVYLALRP